MKRDINFLIIRASAVILVVLCLIVGFGMAGSRNSLNSSQEFFKTLFELFDNIGRAGIVIIGSFFTIRILKKKRNGLAGFRFLSLLSFSIVVLVCLVILPVATDFWSISIALMPFPWSTLPFQLYSTGAYWGKTFSYPFGIEGPMILFSLYLFYQFVVFAGTLFLGRRWQCSMICLFNGCHAESMGEALPFIPHNRKRPYSKQVKKPVKNILSVIQALMIFLNFFVISLWIAYSVTGVTFIPLKTLNAIEGMKYLVFELILMMILWIFVGGRGYCYYCPAGWFLGVAGRLLGQKIETNLTRCTGCNMCNDSCKMSVDVHAAVKKNIPLKSVNCTGCGICIEKCPSKNLKYTTALLEVLGRFRQTNGLK